MHERKQSMPPSFASPQKQPVNMLSPRNIIANARSDIKGFPNSCRNIERNVQSLTSRPGEIGSFARNLEIIGKKENAWAKPANTAQNKINPTLTVKDVVDNVLRIPAFGFTGYNPKASVRDLIPCETHR